MRPPARSHAPPSPHSHQADWDAASAAALALFEFGQAEAAQRGLLRVDTKYEFGKDGAGRILLIDEIHTPDSSRYWLGDTYEQRHAAGEGAGGAARVQVLLQRRHHWLVGGWVTRSWPPSMH